MTTPAEVRAKIGETVAESIDAFKDDPETDRETLIVRMDEDCDTLFGQLVQQGRMTYTVDDLVETGLRRIMAPSDDRSRRSPT